MRKRKIIGLTALLLTACISIGAIMANASYFSRSDWGANEDLRLYNEDRPEPQLVTLPKDFYIRFAKELKLSKVIDFDEKGRELTWPLEYPEKISKIIIHHTGSFDDTRSAVEMITDIYNFHTLGRGWGDIGYNYVIDTKGNIYEGRAGGESVVGAHAGPGNRGSIGIAVLGNYNDMELSNEAYNTLVDLIAKKTRIHGVDPKGKSVFRGEYLDNIIGHDQVMATSCPGKNINKLLPKIREDVAALNGDYNYNKGLIVNKQQAFSFEYTPDQEMFNLNPEISKNYTIRIKNTGRETWNNNTLLALLNDPIVKTGFSLPKTIPINEQSVLPGEYASFSLKAHSKLKDGFYYINYRPIFNGDHKVSEVVSIPSSINKAYYAYEFIDAEIIKNNLKPNQKTLGFVTLKNTGNTVWKNYGINRICLGTKEPQDRVSAFTGTARMGYLKESIVKPGEYGHFIFNLKAPAIGGRYLENFAPVVESMTWLEDKGMQFIINVS